MSSVSDTTGELSKHTHHSAVLSVGSIYPWPVRALRYTPKCYMIESKCPAAGSVGKSKQLTYCLEVDAPALTSGVHMGMVSLFFYLVQRKPCSEES